MFYFNSGLTEFCSKIDLENRFLNENGSVSLMSVDGTDFWIPEPFPFSKAYFSHKFNHVGLRYEIAIYIQTGWIVWVNGSISCGSFPDKIFFISLKFGL